MGAAYSKDFCAIFDDAGAIWTNHIRVYDNITPEMHAMLIDPYPGGAMFWLVEIIMPGYNVIRMTDNTVDTIRAGFTYEKNNLLVGLASLSGDGSVPRIALRVAQDKDHTLEDKINATEGAGGGTVKLIKVHSDFLTDVILELEELVTILTTTSDTDHVIFQLGIPNPLLKKVPLRRYSSTICPYHLPGLFKGLECQYAGADPTCTGKYLDCLTKGNEEHYGAALGLDPAITQV